MPGNTLLGSKPVFFASESVSLPRLCACFERFELCFFVCDSPQFTETAQNNIRKWEQVDLAWLDRVHGLVSRSVDHPKSIDRLIGAVDLLYRALGAWLVMGGETPGWITDANEVIETERIRISRLRTARTDKRGIVADLTRQGARGAGDAAGGHGRWIGGWICDAVPQDDVWALAESMGGNSVVEQDANAADAKPGVEEAGIVRQSTPANAADMKSANAAGRELPAGRELLGIGISEGATVEVIQRIESFGGFVHMGPATIGQVYRDGLGVEMVDVCRGGRVVVAGLAWPSGSIRSAG